MSVYVSIDVHRKRSQVAVVAEDGQVRVNKNVVNRSEPVLRLFGDLPSGTQRQALPRPGREGLTGTGYRRSARLERQLRAACDDLQ